MAGGGRDFPHGEALWVQITGTLEYIQSPQVESTLQMSQTSGGGSLLQALAHHSPIPFHQPGNPTLVPLTAIAWLHASQLPVGFDIIGQDLILIHFNIR